VRRERRAPTSLSEGAHSFSLRAAALLMRRGRGRQVALRRFSNDEFLAPPNARPGAGSTAAVALRCALDFARRHRRRSAKTTQCAPGQILV
jgi:hypothetical protein